jgi:hypothetical protein|uniref:Uncharacterized protein n=1 Tax=viral metagenome TaxID=1070528 RepID=A0A6C0I943_9ZZZZ
MIEYSIEELKYYYNNYQEDTYQNDKEYIDSNRHGIEYLEDTLTDLIDNDYTGNNIYHIFPIFVCAVATSFFASAYIAFG